MKFLKYKDFGKLLYFIERFIREEAEIKNKENFIEQLREYVDKNTELFFYDIDINEKVK